MKTMRQALTLILIMNPIFHLQANETNQPHALQDHNELYVLATEYLKQKTNQKIFEASFELKKLSPQLRLPKCQAPLSLKDRNPNTFAGRITLSISCQKPIWRVFVPVVITGKLPVIISTKGIPKQAVIKKEHIKRVLLPYKRVPKGHLVNINTAIGMRAIKAIPPNKVLKIKDLQPAFWVIKNQQVNIITRIAGIEVKAVGVALKSGVEQEHVPVKNLSSKKIIKGIVIAPNTVLIP